MARLAVVSLFDRFRRRRRSDAPEKVRATAETLAELKGFLAERDGVEGYIEPPTPVYAMTLVLVAGDGEFIRRPVKDAKQAHAVCQDHGVPLYDARIVGYPKRMRDFERGVRQPRVGLDDLPPLEVTDDPDVDD